MSFEKNLSEAIEKYGMLKSVNTVYVGLSGGADSVSLLLALDMLKAEYGFELRAIHINHHIRGEESDRDQHFCEELCLKMGISCAFYDVDAVGEAQRLKLSVEEAARKLRYEIFEGIPENCRTATAHSLDDSAETVIFNLARGTGIKGLTGIPPVRDKIIRPLIFCTRAEIEDFLRRRNQAFVTDSTNLSDDYSRNKIRHRIIPLMEELHGGFAGCVRRMTENLADDCDFIEQAAEKAVGQDLRGVHRAVRRRVILKLLKDNGVSVNSDCVDKIEDAVLSGGGKINVAEDCYVISRGGLIRLERYGKERIVFEQVKVKVGMNGFLCDKSVFISENSGENANVNGNVNNTLTNDRLDCDKIQGDVILRNRRDGDCFTRVNRGFTSSLKKLMNEKYERGERDFIPILADEAGIIWVEGFGVADRVKLDDETKKVWDIKVVENGSDNDN